MHALLFEVEPREGHEDHYFTHAAALRPLLEQHKGLLFIDRFKSQERPNIILSHSHWLDEASLAKWRSDAQHHKSQAAGRYQHFKDYRIRIAHVLTNYVRGEDLAKWDHTGAYRSPQSEETQRLLTIVATEGEGFADGGEPFKSINLDSAYLTVKTVSSEAEGDALISRASQSARTVNAMLASVSRDYGMFERDEAPQYFPDPKTRG